MIAYMPELYEVIEAFESPNWIDCVNAVARKIGTDDFYAARCLLIEAELLVSEDDCYGAIEVGYCGREYLSRYAPVRASQEVFR